MRLDPALVARLVRTCGPDGVLTAADELIVYESDAYPLVRSRPAAVLLPTSTAAAASAVALLHDAGIGIVPRGSGTSLAGGCHVPTGAVCVSTARMTRILAVDAVQRTALVEAGTITQRVSEAVADLGLHYAPDPSSQSACTIGGNVANNAGGPHTLKHGVTAAHVVGLTAVLPDGEVITLGGPALWRPGTDPTRVWIGSEGTFGLITEVTVRLIPVVPARRTILAVFDEMDAASEVVGHIITAGLFPAALEMMDRAILELVEAAYHFGFPADADAVLIIELDGVEAGLDEQMARVVQLARDGGASRIERARTPAAQAALWTARKTAFGTLGRAAPTCITQDGVVPRSQLPHILRYVQEVARARNLRVASNFHAGDGNIHPNLLFDARDPVQLQRAHEASDLILEECLRVGGSISGEHGIGIEKTAALARMFSVDDLTTQQRIRQVFDPLGRANPDKMFEPRLATPPATPASNPHDVEAVLAERLDSVTVNDARVWLPGSLTQLAEALRLCHDQRARAVIVGHDPSTVQPRRSSDTALFLSTERLGTVRAYPQDDLSITVEAGHGLAELLTRVAAAGQHLGAAPRHAIRGSVGGWIATGPFMPQTAAYHGIAHAVLEACFVLGDGTVVRSGARTPKNVAGYDLHHLLVGSGGTIAALGEVTLRLRPRPAVQRAVLCSAADPAAVAEQWTAWRTGPTRPAWATVLSPSGSRNRGLPPRWHTVLILEDEAAAVDWQVRELTRGSDAVTLQEPGVVASLEQWPGHANLEWTRSAAQILDALAALENLGAAAVGHLFSGVVQAHCPDPAQTAIGLRHHCGPGETLRIWPEPDRLLWVLRPPDAVWSQRLAAALDPRGVLRPAGFVGDLT